MNLYEKHSYLNREIRHLKSVLIREYDMVDAGYSILAAAGIFDKETSARLCSMGKKERNVFIGKAQINRPELSKILMETFVRARKSFFEANGIENEDVLYIKKDAIALIGRAAKNLLMEGLEFREKGRYTSYLLLGNVEFYNPGDGSPPVVKGVSQKAREMCANGIVSDIGDAMSRAERVSHDALCLHLKMYRKKYVTMDLPVGHYRELNSEALFRLKYRGAKDRRGFYTNHVNEESKSLIDISYNYRALLMPLFEIMI